MTTLHYRMQMRVPPQVAFAAICDFDHITEWIPGIEKSYISSPGKVNVGTTFVEEGNFLGSPTQIVGVVREYEPNYRLVYEYETGPIPGVWEFNLRSYEGSTQLDFHLELRPAHLLSANLPLTQPMIHSMIVENLESFRKWVEAEPQLKIQPVI